MLRLRKRERQHRTGVLFRATDSTANGIELEIQSRPHLTCI